MAITIDRTGITLTNDTGTTSSPVGDGTLLNAADRTALLDKIDGLFNGTRSATFTLGTLLQVDGFGTHNFSAGGTGVNALRARNTTAGASNFAAVDVGNNSTAVLTRLLAMSSTYTSSGYLQASGSVLEANGAGGLSIATTDAAGDIRFYTGVSVVQRLTISDAGVFSLGTSANMDCGFLAYNSADDTGVASGTTVDFDTEVFDEGGHFSADTFTAPTTGRYFLSASVMISNVSGGALNSGARIVVSNHTSGFFVGYANVANGAQELFAGSVVVDMDAGDTATVQYYSDTGAATVRGDATLRLTWFSGRRVM